MTRVQFLVDYRGHLTNEQFYAAGTVAPFDDGVAAILIADGRAKPLDWQADTLPELPDPPVDWTQIKGVGVEISAALHFMGLTTKAGLLEYVERAGVDGLASVPGISKARAKAIVAWAKE